MKTHLIRLAQRPVHIRLGYFVLTLLLLWLPFAVPIYLLVSDSNLVSILTMVILYAEFIFLLQLWGKNVYQQPQILKQYGWEITQINAVDLLRGLAAGVINIFIVFGLQGLLGWLTWQQPQTFLPGIILEGLIASLGIGFAEELLFRGWLLDELERDHSLGVALWIDALAFAALHFIKPLEAIIHTMPQFPALVLLGLTLGWAKRWRRGRLSLPMGLHGGLVWGYYIINVGELIKYSGQVPDWITGVNQNPLQGVMGVLFMGILALWMRRRTTA
ncbi:CPBP family intramembrane glutamic endopeptidase [Umezakia ovalisporum]|uniref:CPBP family intramembrane metalloprotease n=1 Tax=Umezakia ovalisporum FSS-62 TaxID=2971776 RepID=A0AA43KF72_9CYAN|nr:type II CAAX endopeptidase family protein [Umezakia ovalisporum]MDH6064454.1 CPBP family intramembrane metalloprotease [Umezakia ovalisporum FSS-62]